MRSLFSSSASLSSAADRLAAAPGCPELMPDRRCCPDVACAPPRDDIIVEGSRDYCLYKKRNQIIDTKSLHLLRILGKMHLSEQQETRSYNFAANEARGHGRFETFPSLCPRRSVARTVGGTDVPTERLSLGDRQCLL